MGDVSAGKILADSIDETEYANEYGNQERVDAVILDRVAERLFADTATREFPANDAGEFRCVVHDRELEVRATEALHATAIYVNVRRRLIDAAKAKGGK